MGRKEEIIEGADRVFRVAKRKGVSTVNIDKVVKAIKSINKALEKLEMRHGAASA